MEVMSTCVFSPKQEAEEVVVDLSMNLGGSHGRDGPWLCLVLEDPDGRLQGVFHCVRSTGEAPETTNDKRASGEGDCIGHKS